MRQAAAVQNRVRVGGGVAVGVDAHAELDLLAVVGRGDELTGCGFGRGHVEDDVSVFPGRCGEAVRVRAEIALTAAEGGGGFFGVGIQISDRSGSCRAFNVVSTRAVVCAVDDAQAARAGFLAFCEGKIGRLRQNDAAETVAAVHDQRGLRLMEHANLRVRLDEAVAGGVEIDRNELKAVRVDAAGLRRYEDLRHLRRVFRRKSGSCERLFRHTQQFFVIDNHTCSLLILYYFLFASFFLASFSRSQLRPFFFRTTPRPQTETTISTMQTM